MTDKGIEQVLYNWQNYKNYYDDITKDMAEASVGCGLVSISKGEPKSSVENAIIQIDNSKKDELYIAIKEVLNKPKYADFYCSRYARKEDWEESPYTRRTYFRRRREIIDAIRDKI